MTTFKSVFLWLGGVLFVASLGVAGYAFGVLWGASQPLAPGWRLSATIDAALVTVFALHHSVFARTGVKAAMARIVPESLLRSVYVWIASLLLIAVVVWWLPIGGAVYRVDGWAALPLFAAQLAGVVLTAWAARAIDPLELAGIRPAPARPEGRAYEGPASARPEGRAYDGPAPADDLQSTGPFGLVRHPIYLGWILIVFGTPHMTGDRLVFATLTSLYLVLAIPWEERSLTEAYGAAYRRYQHQVKWRVLPYIY